MNKQQFIQETTQRIKDYPLMMQGDIAWEIYSDFAPQHELTTQQICDHLNVSRSVFDQLIPDLKRFGLYKLRGNTSKWRMQAWRLMEYQNWRDAGRPDDIDNWSVNE